MYHYLLLLNWTNGMSYIIKGFFLWAINWFNDFIVSPLLLPLLLFFCLIFSGFHYWCNTTNCYSYFWFCTILLEFSSIFLYKISFSSSSNICLPFSILKGNKTLFLESANGKCYVKKMFFFVTCLWWPVLHEMVILTKDCFFPQIILP